MRHRISFLQFRIVACLFGLALLLPTAHAAASPALNRVTIAGLNGPTSVGMLKLMETKPSFDGVPSTYEVVSTPDLMVSRLITGAADFGFLPLNLAANLYAKGIPIQLAATTGDGVLYIVSSRTDIHSLSDLKGKRIYDIARGSTPEFLLDYLLEHNGIDPHRDVTIDFTYSHIELAAQLAAGRVDLAVLPEPFVTIALSKNKSLRVVIDLQKEWEKLQDASKPYPTTAFVVRRSLAASHPEVVKQVLAAERRSIEWADAHPEQAGALAERYLGMPAGVIAKAMPRLNLRFVPAREARGAVEQFLGELFTFDPKSIGGKLPDEHFYLDLSGPGQ